MDANISKSSSSMNITKEQATLTEILSQPSVLMLIVFLLTITLIIIFGNILVCYTVFKSRRLQGPGYYFIGCLSIADLFVGILVLPLSIAYYITFAISGKYFMKYIHLN